MGNISSTFNGRNDLPLSENGRKQAALLGNFFKDKKLDRIYTSTLKRTIETADLALPGKKDSFVRLESLNEIHGGDWEGREYDEIFELWGEEFRNWREAPHKAQPPNGENIFDVFDRAVATLDKIARENESDSNVAVFAHGAVIKTVIAFIRSLPLSSLPLIAWYENSSVTEIIFKDGEFNLGFYDNHDHLPDHIKTVANSDWGKAMKHTCRY
jgi:broad specificity phosphatase PhoE